MEWNMEYCMEQVMQKDLGRRLQVGQDIIDSILDKDKSQVLEQDQTMLDRMVDGVATNWVNSSNFKVALLGMDILSALVTRLQERFRTQIGTVLPSLIDRLGDSKDQVRDQDQALLLKIMDQAANPQYVWDRMLGGFKHKNNRTRESVCICLIATLNVYGAQGLTLSKIVPHICHLLGDPTSQVRDGAMNCLVEIYRHVGERVRMDLGKKGLPQSRYISSSVVFPIPRLSVGSAIPMTQFSECASSSVVLLLSSSQLFSNREMEDAMTKIREVLADDKRDWEHRVTALKKMRSLLLAGAVEFDGFSQQLRLTEAAFKMSSKDLRSQVVREACITLGHLSYILGNRFDHCAESIMPTLLTLVSNSAKVMATSGIAVIRLIIRHTHYPRLIPIVTGSCQSKSVAVRRRSFEFLDLLLQEWQTSSLERNVAVLTETIKKGVHDADSEARSVARKCYWTFHGHFSREAEQLFQALESSYQKALQSHMKSSDSILSLPASDRSSSSSQESLKGPSTPGSLQRSRSDVDVNAAATACAKTRMTPVPSSPAPFSAASALPPGSYASLGEPKTYVLSLCISVSRVPLSQTVGRSRAKMVSVSQTVRSGSPGRLLSHTYGRIPRATGATTPSDRRPKVPRSHGCSRDTSPDRSGLARSRIPRPSMSQGCSRDTSRESSRDTSPARGFSPLERLGLAHQARISASVNAMRILNTGTEVEAAVADRRPVRRRYESPGIYSDDDANSDASSACSERSYGSRNGGPSHYMRQTEDVAEVLNHCASSNWSERKEGLLGLQNLLRYRSVFSMFLETLVDFITLHREDLQDWLFVLLTQLLKKMGADLLGSVQAKVQKALDVTRDSFPFDQQFNILMRFIVDQTQTPNLKVKVAILRYIECLARQMDPADFVNSSETRLAVSRIITWTTEPKSSDVRKAAQVVLIALFELNTPEFTMLLGALPKTFQDGATKLLHSHLRNSSNTGVVRPDSDVHAYPPPLGSVPSSRLSFSPSRLYPPFSFPPSLLPSLAVLWAHYSRLWGWSADGLSKYPPPFPSPLSSTPAVPSLKTLRSAYSPSMLEYDTENLNTDQIYSSLRGVTEAIQNFSFRSQEDLMEPGRGKREDTVREGVSSHTSHSGADVVEGPGGRTALDNKTSLLNTPSPRSFSGPRGRDYNPYNYTDTISAYDKAALKETVYEDDVEQLRDGEALLKELSNPSERPEERRGALVELLKIAREDSLAVWEEHFKTMLLLLLETLSDQDHTIRALALRVLKEILRNQPARFKNYAELTIMKTLEAHKDSHKEVVRAAEESASTLAGSIHPEQCIKVLCPIVQTADYPINLASIKMQTKVIERITKESLHQLLPDIIPGLLQGYDNTESSVRKASVFCLVAVYSVIGEELKPYLAQLTGSKMKLLNLYIKRAQTSTSNSSSSSDISSY
uniref:TOG domain-containing protein n=1 Tax=Oncorhynchus tshawytscha TaxID=74940 RepID=A0A8C8I8P7_ONCTS